MLKLTALFVVMLVFSSCKEAVVQLHIYEPSDQLFKYSGRYEVLNNTSTALIGSGAFVEFNVVGDSTTIYLQTSSAASNYYVITVNDQYIERSRIEGDSIQKIGINLLGTEPSNIKIFKATEAFNDRLVFHGAEAEALLPVKEKAFKIEFIGDSITCGALADDSQIPCGAGEYYDQHNAYLAYGPRLARRLNADFMLSSVSGMGVYRNWNDENIEEANLPQVYGNLYLNKNNLIPFETTIPPDVVSICLGTNDLSDGDGIKRRLAFNSDKFISSYIQFVERIYKRYPEAQVVLLNSPVLDGEKNDSLVSCLTKVQQHFMNTKNKEIKLIQFEKTYTNGCNFHPSVDDNKLMADHLEPFFSSIKNNN